MRFLFLALSFLLLFAAPGPCASLSVVTEEWPPYNYAEDGAAAGLVTEVVRAALDRAGFDYTIKVLPWARAYSLALHDPDVLIYSMLKLPQREPLFQWVRLDGLGVEMQLFRPRHREDIRIETLDDAKAYRVGLTRDSAPHHFLLRHGFQEGVNLFPVSDELLNARKSEPGNNRIDLTTGDPLSQGYRLRQAGLPADYWVRVLPLFSTDIYMAFSLSTPPETVERVRKALRQLRDEGFINATRDGYLRRLAP